LGNELANKVVELIVIYLAQKKIAPDRESKNLKTLYQTLTESFKDDVRFKDSLAQIENMTQQVELTVIKDIVASRIESDSIFANKIHELIEAQSLKRRSLWHIVPVPIAILLITVIGYIVLSASLYYLSPGPFQPEICFPKDGAKDFDTKESLSWIGGNPQQPIISILMRLGNKDLSQKITYYIYLYNESGYIIEKGTKVDDYAKKQIYYQPNEPLEQDRCYHWRVEAENDFGKNTNGSNWSFETIKGPIINISYILNMLNESEYLYAKKESGAWIKATAENNGKTINLSYYLPEKDSWAGIYKRLNENELFGTKGLTFRFKRGGAANTLELKFAYGDKKGSNETTYQYLWPSAKLSHISSPVEIEYKNIISGWDNKGIGYDRMPTDLDIMKATSIHFAISNKYNDDEPGMGWIAIEDIRGILDDKD